MSTKTTRRPLLQKAAHVLGEARRKMGLQDFPFDSILSMAPLIEHWLEQKSSASGKMAEMISVLEDYVVANPDILTPYDDVGELLQRHQSMMDLLFAGIFPPLQSENIPGYAAPPFLMKPFYVTEGLRALLSDDKTEIKFEQFGKFDTVPFSIRACLIILDKYYGITLDWTLPFLFSFTYEQTGMQKYYKTSSVLDYLQVKTRQKPPEISRSKIDFLLKHMEDEELWLREISPEVFFFEGFFMSTMSDVTEVETLSRLRKKLMEPGTLLDEISAREIATLTRMYMRLPGTEVGISALDYPAENSVAHRYKIHFPIVEGLRRLVPAEDKNSVYEQACRLNRLQVVSDLNKCNNLSPIERKLKQMGFRSLMVLPLHDTRKNIIGLMELASPKPYVFTHLKVMKLKEILPLYNLALDHARQSVENRITSIIQEQYTNIHPSILWKFTETAFNYLEERENSEDAVLDPIVFRSVYPLFGQIDINSSTSIRNNAVQADIKKNLDLLIELLDITYDFTKFQLLRKHSFDLRQRRDTLLQRFDSSQEAALGSMLVNDVHPLLRQIKMQNPVLASIIDEYFYQLDTKHDLIYEARHKYEVSLKRINRIIGNHLQKQETINQSIIPHYFEKYKTDGLEYTIFVGQSLLQKGKFGNHHLQNLRLWQLRSMIEVHKLLEADRNRLPIEMTVSYLILAFSNPLTIRFLMEEKRFDVDGAYNIQFEVLKKRVDKAFLLDSEERLTNANKIAIVYLHDNEKNEYLEYFDFLITEGLLGSEIEDVELEPVQGLLGVKALRVPFT